MQMQMANASWHVDTHLCKIHLLTHHTLQYIHLQPLTHTHTHTCRQIYTLTHPPYSIRYTIYCIQCYQTPPRGNMCLCLWLENILPRLTMSQTQQSSTEVVFVPVAQLQTDTAATRKIAATFKAFFPILHFYLFQSFICGSQSPVLCVPLLCIPLTPWSFFFFFFNVFFFNSPYFSLFFPFSIPLFSQLLCLWPLSSLPSFCPPVPDSVRSCTQYCIDWFPSVFSDLAVIVPERSQQIDFSEKDTVMFGNLWLHRAN